VTHNFEPLPKAKRSTCSVSWPVCKRCGLIGLRNEASERAARKPCPGRDDP
jgi:hypothetical protein